ncbi:hypothetical protein [Streptomyces sp. NPDC050388]|uniref:hypothetical protein n=1 Tax=Streptomyces sp. NPDC050388 TaxID=3155781 RepID=UPI00342BAE47
MRGTARLLTGLPGGPGLPGGAGLAGPALALAAVGLLVAPAGYAGEADAAPAGHSRDTAPGNLEVYPSSVVAGSQVTVNTAACGDRDTAAGDATAVGAGRFTLAPSAHERDSIGRFRVPPGAQPGTYEIVAKCSADGQRVTGDLVVRLTSAAQQVYPHGSVKTGVGSALGADPAQTAVGVATLAVAAAGGTWLLHRRARGDGI